MAPRFKLYTVDEILRGASDGGNDMITAPLSVTEQGDTMTETMNLGDIPDLSVLDATTTSEWTDGWYSGTILEQRSFTDKNGNDRVFETNDQPSQAGDSRNIKLQVVVKRQSDGQVLNLSNLINYRPEDLAQSAVEAVVADRSKPRDEQDATLTRAFLTLQRLNRLQKIAGVRQFQRNGNGGLDLHPCYGKTGWFRLGPDDRNPQFKAIKDMRVDKPVKAITL